jgi:hypothetical protein
MRLVPAIAAAMLTAGCANQTGDENAAPIQADETVTGVAHVVGTDVETWVQVRTDAAEALRVVGDMESEIGSLQGARVRIVGARVDDAGIGQAFHVVDYELLEIGGEVPIVGTLLRVESDFWLAEPDSVGGERLRLIGVSQAIGEATGGKIWVVGLRGSSEIRVQSYGVIRTPPGS